MVKHKKLHSFKKSNLTRRMQNKRKQKYVFSLNFFLIFVMFIIGLLGGFLITKYHSNPLNLVFKTEHDSSTYENNSVERGGVTEFIRPTEESPNSIKSLTTYEQNTDNYSVMFNQYRQSKGYAPLEFTDDLNKVAELRLKELYTDFSHYSPGNYNERLAENIAMISFGGLNDFQVLSMWQDSPNHNANLLGYYKYTGYACLGNYAIQLFSFYPTVNGVPQLPLGWYWTE